MHNYVMKSFSVVAMSIAMLASSTAAADESKARPSGQREMGFVVQGSTTLASKFALLGQSLLLGGKFYRFSFGVGIELALLPPQMQYAADVRLAVLRTVDKRVELFVSGSGSYRPPESYETGEGDVRVRLGLGIRYWVHPRIGVDIASGLMRHVGRFSRTSDSTGEFTVVSSYGQAGMMAVF